MLLCLSSQATRLLVYFRCLLKQLLCPEAGINRLNRMLISFFFVHLQSHEARDVLATQQQRQYG